MKKPKPSFEENRKYTTLGILGIIAYIALQKILPEIYAPYIFYGKYGAIGSGILTAIVAHLKGRNVVGWFALGLWFVPAALIIILIMPKLYDKLCDHCMEPVSPLALICPHYRRQLNADIPNTITCQHCGFDNRYSDFRCKSCNSILA